MALGNALALQVTSPDIRTAQNFQASQANALQAKSEGMRQEAATLEQFATLGLGILDGNLDGEINQDRLNQTLDLLGDDNPLAAHLRQNPELLRTITRGSLDVLRYVQDEKKFDLAKQQFEAQLAEAQTKSNPFQDRFEAGQQFGLEGDALDTFALTGSVPGTTKSNVTYGLNPIYGTDASGKSGMGVQGSDGSFKLVDTGGFQPLAPFDLNAQKAAGTSAGKNTTEAALNLPNTIAQAEQSLANLSGLLPQFDQLGQPVAGSNKGFDEQFGTVGPVPQQWLGALDGTEKAGFQSRIRQVQGEAFLTAITQLKGLGALSDAEGQTATKAITRISEKLPQGEFVKAVKELQDIVAKGVERAKAKAAQSPATGMLNTSSNDAGIDDLLAKYAQ